MADTEDVAREIRLTFRIRTAGPHCGPSCEQKQEWADTARCRLFRDALSKGPIPRFYRIAACVAEDGK